MIRVRAVRDEVVRWLGLEVYYIKYGGEVSTKLDIYSSEAKFSSTEPKVSFTDLTTPFCTHGVFCVHVS